MGFFKSPFFAVKDTEGTFAISPNNIKLAKTLKAEYRVFYAVSNLKNRLYKHTQIDYPKHHLN